MKIQHSLTLALNDRADQIVLVFKVVIQLRLTGSCGPKYVVHAYSRHASFEDQVCCPVDNPLASLPSLFGQSSRLVNRSLPVPATFVIDRSGIVRAAFVSPDWRYRVEPSEIIAALEALQ